MKTYLELLNNDYKYLNDIRYYIGDKKNKIYGLEFNLNLLKTIEDYHVKELDYHKTIINVLNVHYLEHAKDYDSKCIKQYIIKDISEHKNSIIDIIGKCMHNISRTIDEEKKHG